jgi:mRNA interferase MazF
LRLPVVRGGLYAADLNPPRGTEAGNIRPAVAIQTDLLNEVGHASTVILPCTTRLTGESLLRVLLPGGIAGNRVDCEIMIDQVRAIDNRRLRKQLGTVPGPVLAEIEARLRHLLDLGR